MSRQVANALDSLRLLRSKPRPRHDEAWQLWHLWTVAIPRRSITGELVWGTVLRRRDESRWIYKKYDGGWDLN